MEEFYRQKEDGTKKLKMDYFRQVHLLLEEGGISAINLTNVDQKISDSLVSVPLLERQEAETAIRLSIKFWLGDLA